MPKKISTPHVTVTVASRGDDQKAIEEAATHAPTAAAAIRAPPRTSDRKKRTVSTGQANCRKQWV